MFPPYLELRPSSAVIFGQQSPVTVSRAATLILENTSDGAGRKTAYLLKLLR